MGCILLRPQENIPLQYKHNASTLNGDLMHLESQATETNEHGFYLIALAVLPQYRKRGVGTCEYTDSKGVLFDFKNYVFILTMCFVIFFPISHHIASSLLLRAIQSLSEKSQASWLRLHVQTSNEQAMSIYRRVNFKIEGRIEDYYAHLKLNPSSAYALKYDFGRNAALSNNTSTEAANLTSDVRSLTPSDQQAVV